MAFWPAWLHVWSQFHNVQRVLRCSASDCGFITYFTECGADVTSSLYINPWTALNFRGVSLLTLNQDGLLSLSFAVFLPGFQWTTGGVWSRVWSVYEQQQQKKKSQGSHSVVFSFPSRNTVNLLPWSARLPRRVCLCCSGVFMPGLVDNWAE